ncbi:hypothetical protein [Ornithinimicrobium avium]|uniref:Uncharacterized protein n=1 Tax=Ornithinimicrobium avium TaxID=2283195 RepID=A0A345NRV4_9MICO|nr:hypothetical protein [Ornithinimicrobium avium]AXH97762.1 hypothetical protein DV701_18050 [Ornithinimicrobium avium]
MKLWSAGVAGLALLLVVLATVRGFDPGDSAGAVRMSSTREMALVSAGVALVALLPLRRLSTVLTVVAALLLLVAVGFWVGLVPA